MGYSGSKRVYSTKLYIFQQEPRFKIPKESLSSSYYRSLRLYYLSITPISHITILFILVKLIF